VVPSWPQTAAPLAVLPAAGLGQLQGSGSCAVLERLLLVVVLLVVLVVVLLVVLVVLLSAGAAGWGSCCTPSSSDDWLITLLALPVLVVTLLLPAAGGTAVMGMATGPWNSLAENNAASAALLVKARQLRKRCGGG
jgi:hypothetical protein